MANNGADKTTGTNDAVVCWWELLTVRLRV